MAFSFFSRLAVLLAILMSCFVTPASAEIINFEDSGGGYIVPAGYKGFTWSGGMGDNSWVLGAENRNVFSGSEAHSGQYFTWSNGATNLDLSGELFDFNSMWARSGWIGFTATVQGFLNGIETFSQDFTVTTDYQLFTFNFAGIDSLKITNQLTNLLIDDISINTASVPEPGTLALLSLALLSLGLTRRRKQ